MAVGVGMVAMVTSYLRVVSSPQAGVGSNIFHGRFQLPRNIEVALWIGGAAGLVVAVGSSEFCGREVS